MKRDTKSRNKRSNHIFPPWEIHHYVSLTPDGMYHIQNILGTMIGQHHVHSERSYKIWKGNIESKYIHFEKAEFCACGLGPGYVKEFNGEVWFNEEFE